MIKSGVTGFKVFTVRQSKSKRSFGVAQAALALEDGTFFLGEAFGHRGTVTGEVCFNTSMTGYQEILTDPSYRGQILTMTAPQIGNYWDQPSRRREQSSSNGWLRRQGSQSNGK